MPVLRPTRRFAVATSFAFSTILCASAGAQSNLPPTPPTSVAPLSATETQQTTASARAHHAEVRYESGILSIDATNSSLNAILRQISKQTGMKITGGVSEERVFGHYGPAPVADILATLLHGTGTNMVLRQTALNTPEELILTPRVAGATPPNPNAAGFNDDEDDRDRDEGRNVPGQNGVPGPPIGFHGGYPGGARPHYNQGSVPPSIPQPANNVNGNPANTSPTASTLPVTNSVPTDNLPTPSTTPPAPQGIVDAPNPPDAGTVNPVTTNPPVSDVPPPDGSNPDGTH